MGLHPMILCSRGFRAEARAVKSQIMRMSWLTRKRMPMARTMISVRLASSVFWSGGGVAARVGDDVGSPGSPMTLAPGRLERGCSCSRGTNTVEKSRGSGSLISDNSYRSVARYYFVYMLDWPA